MAKELCNKCGAEMEVGRNKNKGYFATCPNKANHANAKAPDPPQLPEVPKADTPPVSGEKTMFGW
jgi:hypothetical protein